MEDLMIIKMYIDRSEEAIYHTDKKYGRYLFKIAMNILNRNEDAEECRNDTYLTAWNQIPPDYPKKILAYLGKITRNIALNRYDYLTAKKRNNQFDAVLSELEECLSSPYTVENQFEENEIADEISVFLKEANINSRNIFIRRYWYTDSIKDIARRFEISESKVKSTLFRTRNKLRLHLERKGYKI